MNKSLCASVLFAVIFLFAGSTRAQVTASFTANNLSGCAPLVVNFTNTSTGNINQYSWDLGNTTLSTKQHPSTSYTTPGVYTVKLTVSGPGGTDVEIKTAYITVHPPPTVSFTYNTISGCAPLSVGFTSTVAPNVTPTGVTYFWDFGDGSNSPSANPTHVYTAGGTYSVSLTATNSKNCSKSVVQTSIITVHPKPVGTFNALQTQICTLPATALFSNGATGNGPFNYKWDFGDGSSTTTGNNPSHVYTSAGSYTVTLVVTDSRGCKDSIVQPNFITTYPNIATFTAPAHACDSTSPTFTNTTTPGVVSTEWDFGDGGSATGSPTSHFYTAPGTYNVKMVTALANGCSDTVFKTIIIDPKPVLGINYNIPCPPPSTVQFSASSNIASTYQWSWASGGSATGATVNHAYSVARIDTAVLIATTAAGCSDTFTEPDVYVRDIDFIDLLLSHEGCIPLTVTMNTFVGTNIPCTPRLTAVYPACPYPYAVTSWSWNFDGVATSNLQQPTYTFTTPGFHVATLTVTTANGCTHTESIVFKAGTPVPPSFTVSPTTACVKVPVYFTNTTPNTSINYYWEVGEPDSGNNQYHNEHRYLVPGVYTIKLISEYNGCYDTLVKPLHVTINPSNAQFKDSVFCAPSTTVLFTDTSIGATTHLWKFGDGNTSTLASPTHTYATMGTYFPTHITWNSTYGCRDTVVDSVVLVQPVISLATDSTLCLGDTLKLYGVFNGLAVDNYRWEINGYYDSKDSSTVFRDSLLGVTGFHRAVWFVRTRGLECVDSIARTVIVSHPVAALAASPLLGCTPMPVTFSDSTAFTPGTMSSNRYWIFGNGDTASNNNPSTIYTYMVAGVYNVKLKVTDWLGCADSITKSAYVEARHPEADFTVRKQDACIGRPVTFTNLSYGATKLSYKWSFGDGDTAVALTPLHSYRAVGTYTVTLIVTDSTGCSDTMTKAAYISVTRPTASFTLSDTLSVCPPLTVNFTSTSTNAVGLIWDFGNTGTSVLPTPVSTFSTPAAYTVMLVAVDFAGCTDTATAKVHILGYSGALTYTPMLGCAPLEVFFTASVTNVPSIIWDFSDGTTLTATTNTASHTYLNPGNYLPKLIFSDGAGCSASSTGLDTIRVDGVIAGFKALPPCEKTNILLVDTSFSFFSAIANSRWDFGGAGIATGNPVQRTYPSAGTYPVTLISTNANGCKDTLFRNITIFPLPHVVAPPDTAVCVPDAITLSATGALTYVWSPATALSCTSCASPVASPTAPAVYIVTGTDSNGCAAKDTIRIGMQTKTTFVTNGSGEICLGQYYQLFAAGATTYNWTPESTLDSPNIPNPRASPKVNTTYIVTGREGSCLADTHSIKVIVRPLPVVDAGGDLKVVAGNFVLLQASGTGITRVAWDADPSLSCFGCYAPEARPKVSTTYRITAYNEFGCTAIDSVRVLVLCDGSQLSIPNTFTPNGDGLNDFFFPRGQGIDHMTSFRIYSRWGELLFNRSNVAVNDEFAGWNGTFNGRKLNPDVYVYIIEATCDTGEPIKFKGDVTLMR